MYFWLEFIFLYKLAIILKMLINAKPNCPLHNLPLQYLCTLTSCTSPITVCKICQTFHSQHKQKLVIYQKFPAYLRSNMQRQNALEVEVGLQNDSLSLITTQSRKIFEDREKVLISAMMKKFEEQKNLIVQKLRAEKQKQKDNVIQYFDKMSQKRLLNYRVLFSSQQGLQNFYRAYRQYCQFSDISCHLKQDILPPVQQEDQSALLKKVRKQLSGTLMQDIMNYIKLKISKRDILRISNIAKDCTSVIRQPPPPPPPPVQLPRNMGLPPLSPTRKVKTGKTEVNIVFNRKNTQP